MTDPRRVPREERRAVRSARGPDEHRVVSGKKNTRLWCKGKPGVEHQTKCMPRWQRPGREPWYFVRACSVCGKHLEHYCTPWPDANAPPAREPEWLKAWRAEQAAKKVVA